MSRISAVVATLVLLSPPLGAQEPSRITATWEAAPLADVVQEFARVSGRTLVLPQGVAATITATVTDEPWPEALRRVLAGVGLRTNERLPGVLYVERVPADGEREQQR